MGEAILARASGGGGGGPFEITEVDISNFSWVSATYMTWNCPKELMQEGVITRFIVTTNSNHITIVGVPNKFLTMMVVDGASHSYNNAKSHSFSVGSSGDYWTFSNSDWTSNYGTPSAAYSLVEK